MRLHILGVCGTFMSGIAVLAKQQGHEVTGSDMNVYPPMSTQLREQGIVLQEGYDPAHIASEVDGVIVGNVIKRGNPAMEYILDKQIPYMSGPQWLFENILKDKWVLGISGTHGKTTTSSMVAWILEATGQKPGFLIGGVPENFGVSARLGDSSYFVIEADEYDCAFFDKRAKFIHYHPKTLILNNLEYDHADIYPDLNSIKQQFHYLIRTIPSNGLIIKQALDENLKDVLSKGCWTPETTFSKTSGDWQAKLIKSDGSVFGVLHKNKEVGEVHWSLLGNHNVENALAAIAACHHAGVSPDKAVKALASFKNVKRRMEIKGEVNGITVYDDFAHHPTAIATTLAGLRAKVGKARIIAVLEFGSYTMKTGVHKDKILESLVDADLVMCKTPEANWDLNIINYKNADLLIAALVPQLRAGDHVIVMSNSGFEGIHQKLMGALLARSCLKT